MYPPGTFKAPYGLPYRVLSLQDIGGKPYLSSSNYAATKQEYEGYIQILAAVKTADTTVQNMATMGPHYENLSQSILMLRAACKELFPRLDQLKLEEVTWRELWSHLGRFEFLLDLTMSEIEEYEKKEQRGYYWSDEEESDEEESDEEESDEEESDEEESDEEESDEEESDEEEATS